MARYDQDVVPDQGHFMRTLFGLKGPLHLDVHGGGASFKKSGETVTPTIVHFASWGIFHPAYARECLKLRAQIDPGAYPPWVIKSAIPWVYVAALLRWGAVHFLKKISSLLRWIRVFSSCRN